MGLLTLPLRLPLLPVSGLIRLAQILQEQAERELYDPAAVRRQLEDAAEAADAGLMSDEEVGELEAEAVRRVTGQQTGAPTGVPGGGEER